MRRPLVCSFDFHTSIGGSQRIIVTVLRALSSHYSIAILDPYENSAFRTLLGELAPCVDSIGSRHRRPWISTRRGIGRACDFVAAAPLYAYTALQLRRYVKSRHIDVMYVNQTKSALIAGLAVPRGVPIIYHCHSPLITGTRFLARFSRRLAKIIANSQFTASELVTIGVPEDLIEVITNPVPLEEIRAQSERALPDCAGTDSQRPVVLVAHALIEPLKGTELAVRAFAEILGMVDAELWIAGDATAANAKYVERVKALTEELGIASHVRFLGMRQDIYAVMRHATVVVVPSLVRESFGLVAAEAMALGKAVVVSNRGALPDIVEDGHTGVVFDPDQPGELTRALARLILEPEMRARYGKAASLAIEERYSLEPYKARIRELFDAVMRDRARRADTL